MALDLAAARVALAACQPVQGRAPEYLRYDQDLLRITRHVFEGIKGSGA